MRYIYFQVLDLSKDFGSIGYTYFGKRPVNCDLAGIVTSMARQNKSNINDIRLFVFPSKQKWEEAEEVYAESIETNEE